MAKVEKWKLCQSAKRPPQWVLQQEECNNKADLVAKLGSKTVWITKAETTIDNNDV